MYYTCCIYYICYMYYIHYIHYVYCMCYYYYYYCYYCYCDPLREVNTARYSSSSSSSVVAAWLVKGAPEGAKVAAVVS